jgi:signal transduction histidine kinase
MKRNTLIKFLLLSLVCALILAVLTLMAIRSLTENSNIDFRKGLLLSLARQYENTSIIPETPRPPDPHHHDGPFKNHTWVVDENGVVTNASTPEPLPLPWKDLPHPEKIHDVGQSYELFALGPSVTVVRLAEEKPTYLIISHKRDNRIRNRDVVQFALIGLALAFSALISLLMTFFYLRRKSLEARSVLLKLEQGDLKARFQIKQFDEMGSLMLDFNRMAAEIERLVGRLEETEQTRRTLFQELSHDLRTPLTSLRASIDTLALHWEEMPSSDRRQVIEVCRAESLYFMELLENLLFIAQMDEPKYKKSTDTVNLLEILESEVQIRQAHELGSNRPLSWQWIPPREGTRVTVPGDSHLIKRMIKNILENAARYAQHHIRVELAEVGSEVKVTISDDGPGMTLEQQKGFGTVRTRRVLENENITRVSLGLGSVIIKKVLALHHGSLTLDGSRGTKIEFRLPLI